MGVYSLREEDLVKRSNSSSENSGGNKDSKDKPQESKGSGEKANNSCNRPSSNEGPGAGKSNKPGDGKGEGSNNQGDPKNSDANNKGDGNGDGNGDGKGDGSDGKGDGSDGSDGKGEGKGEGSEGSDGKGEGKGDGSEGSEGKDKGDGEGGGGGADGKDGKGSGEGEGSDGEGSGEGEGSDGEGSGEGEGSDGDSGGKDIEGSAGDLKGSKTNNTGSASTSNRVAINGTQSSSKMSKSTEGTLGTFDANSLGKGNFGGIRRSFTDLKKDLDAQLRSKVESTETLVNNNWESIVRKLLSELTGIRTFIDENIPSRRLPGVLESEEDTVELGSLVLCFDVSGSMGYSVYKKSLGAIEKIMKTSFSKELKTIYVMFYDTGVIAWKKFNNIKKAFEYAKHPPEGGGNNFCGALEHFQTTVLKKSMDLYINISDGGDDYGDIYKLQYKNAGMNKVKKKLLHVLVGSMAPQMVNIHRKDLGKFKKYVILGSK